MINMFRVYHVLLLLESYALGSVIVFQSSPTPTIQGLTQYVRLRCSLNDTAASSTVVGRRDTTSTTGNVEQVSSIIIMHNNIDIASVAQSHSAKSMVAASNIEVSGDVSSKTGERGFLEVKLHYPTPIQLGEFDCEIVATKPNGHGAIFNINTGTNVTQPTIMDSVLYTRDVEDAKDVLAARTDSLEEEKDAAKQRLTSLEARNTALESRSTALESENTLAKKRLAALEKTVSALLTYTQKPPKLINCQATGWVNGFDSPVNYVVPPGAILTGQDSYHDNHHEDRRFQFHFCYLSAP